MHRLADGTLAGMTQKEAIAQAKKLAKENQQAYVAYRPDGDGDWRVVSNRAHSAKPWGPSSVWYTVGVTGAAIFSGNPPEEGEMPMDELRQRRRQLGLTQPELADLLGIHRVTISNWERGHHPIPRWLTLAMDQLRTLSYVEPRAS